MVDIRNQISVVGDIVGEYPRSVRALVTAVVVLVIAGIVAAVAGWDLVVALLAGIGILGTAIGVLVFTARNSYQRR